MTDLASVIILAIVQGITEWLPISSSGHLVILQEIFGLNGGLGLNIGVHFGTLLAVLIYYYKDVFGIVKEFFKGKWEKGSQGRLGLYLILATIPAAFIGFFFGDFFESAFSSVEISMLGFGITGIILILASLINVPERKINSSRSFIMGLGQILALLPGISRSGITVSTGLFLGLKEREALKFSFLMAVPIIIGASLVNFAWNGWDYYILLGTVISFIVGLLTIGWLDKIVFRNKKNLIWFGIYALLVAIALFFFV